METERGTVCVTGASGFIGSWLVMNLLQRGYSVRATVRNPGDKKKVKHLLDLPNANMHLTLWKANLADEGSYDEAIDGCIGVFHVATPIDFNPKDPENEVIKPTINGILSIMRSCLKAKTVKRLVYTSTAGTIALQQHQPSLYDESVWTDVDFCRAKKMTGWMYFVGKTLAEKAAWEFTKENYIDFISIIPPLVIGQLLMPSMPPSMITALSLITSIFLVFINSILSLTFLLISSDSQKLLLLLLLLFLKGNEAHYSILMPCRLVHLYDLCNAHIYLFEHPQAKGRYICSSHYSTFIDLATTLKEKYPEYNIPTKFKGVDETLKAMPFSSKKLLDLGFKFKYNSDDYEMGDLFAEAIESCRSKGLIPLSNAYHASGDN